MTFILDKALLCKQSCYELSTTFLHMETYQDRRPEVSVISHVCGSHGKKIWLVFHISIVIRVVKDG